MQFQSKLVTQSCTAIPAADGNICGADRGAVGSDALAIDASTQIPCMGVPGMQLKKTDNSFTTRALQQISTHDAVLKTPMHIGLVETRKIQGSCRS